MDTKKKKKHLTGTSYVGNQMYGGFSGSNIQGFNKNTPTHPMSYAGGLAVNGASQSRFEGLEPTVSAAGVLAVTTNYFPRACIDRSKIVNADFNFVPYNAAPTASMCGNVYFSGFVSSNGDASIPLNMSNAAGAAGGAIANSQAGVIGPAFPCLPNSTTPSINVYMRQQARFFETRARFLTQIVSVYPCPFANNTVNTGAGGGNNSTVVITEANGVGANVNALLLGEQQQQFCLSVQNGPTNCAQTWPGLSTTVGGSTARALSSITGAWTTANSSFYQPPELFTEMEISLGELSMELDMIGEICLENCQVQIQLQANLPQNCLSAWLQPSLYALNGSNLSSGANANQFSTNVASGNIGPNTAQVVNYLNACTLGSATYQITDLTMRLEYIDYPESAYEIVKKYHMAPKPYYSLRQQLDPIPIASSGTFTQRIAINNPMVVAFVCFIVPTNNNKATYIPLSGQATAPQIQDTLVNYMGCNPPTDLRGTYLDSYYLNLSSYYIDDGSGRRYESNDLNIANPALSTYLRTMDGLQTAFGRYLDLEFTEWVQNRSIIVIPFNINQDPSLALTSSQVILQLTLDGSSRIESSTLYNECNTNLVNQFSLLTFAVTSQSLVDCSYVRV